MSPSGRPYFTALPRRLTRTIRRSAGSHSAVTDARRQVELEAHLRLVDLGAHEIDRRGHDLLHDVHAGAAHQLEPSAVDARELQVVLDEVQQVLALGDDALHLVHLLRLERPQISIDEQARVGHDRGDRILDLMTHEREHLEVRVVGGGELLDTPGLLHGLAQPFRDRHLELHVVRVERARTARVPEEKADDAALDHQRARHARTHALADQQTRRVAAGMLSGVRLEVVDDARLAAPDDVLQRAALEVARVALGQEQRLVVGARVVREHAPAALVHERQTDAVARDQRARSLEEEVGEVVQRLLRGDLLVDHAQGRTLRVADATAGRAPLNGSRYRSVECRLTTAPPADDCHGQAPEAALG